VANCDWTNNMSKVQWHRLGRVDDLKTKPLQQIQAGEVVLALSYRDGQFGAISGRCNHVGGPLGEGHVDADGYVVCPWHHWHFHRLTGEAHAGIPAAAPRYDLKIEDGDLFVNLVAATQRINAPHPAHPLTRPITREPGPIRIVGISTSAMNRDFPRYSTSEALLQTALDHAGAAGHQTKLIRLNDLNFRLAKVTIRSAPTPAPGPAPSRRWTTPIS
jgi:nitrite reductase/ring-hydroxylating ferredoxin subunit